MGRIPRVSLATEQVIGQIRAFGSGSLSPRELILAMVPAIEARVDDFVRSEVHSSEIANIPLGRRLISDHVNSYFQTWSDREKLLAAVLDSNVSGTKPGQRFARLREIRNALMHGNGSLTAQQTSSFTTTLELKRLASSEFSIGFLGNTVFLDAMDRDSVCSSGVDYLELIEHLSQQGK